MKADFACRFIWVTDFSASHHDDLAGILRTKVGKVEHISDRLPVGASEEITRWCYAVKEMAAEFQMIKQLEASQCCTEKDSKGGMRQEAERQEATKKAAAWETFCRL